MTNPTTGDLLNLWRNADAAGVCYNEVAGALRAAHNVGLADAADGQLADISSRLAQVAESRAALLAGSAPTATTRPAAPPLAKPSTPSSTGRPSTGGGGNALPPRPGSRLPPRPPVIPARPPQAAPKNELMAHLAGEKTSSQPTPRKLADLAATEAAAEPAAPAERKREMGLMNTRVPSRDEMARVLKNNSTRSLARSRRPRPRRSARCRAAARRFSQASRAKIRKIP